MGFIDLFSGVISKVYNPQAKEVKKIQRYVEEVNTYEERMQALKDSQFPEMTVSFRERLENGETTFDILPEAFALAREAARRVLGMWPYNEQVLGGVVLHQGRIAEMKTGEGKTLAATMPAYLNAISGKGVHIVTVNDYLAQRDCAWMGPVYEMLGLTVGVIVHGLDARQRREAYRADITYGTNNEFGFDYLRDNMVLHQEHLAQRPLHYAIVDEVDSILVDEARTPLIISGRSNVKEDVSGFKNWKQTVESLIRKQKSMVNEFLTKAAENIKNGNLEEAAEKLLLALRGDPKNKKLLELLKEPGVSKQVERVRHEYGNKLHQFLDDNLYFYIEEATNLAVILSEMESILAERDPGIKAFIGNKQMELEDDEEKNQSQNSELEQDKADEEKNRLYNEGSRHYSDIQTLLKAYSLFEKNVDYVVQNDKVTIVDEFTGRLMHGRRYSEGLHQAIEAKEGVRIEETTRTLASITFQNYFRPTTDPERYGINYQKLAGMTGTAITEEDEFRNIYGMDVVVIPTHEPMIREDFPDAVYRTANGKFKAVVEEIAALYHAGQPVLVGTISIEKSEELSRILKQQGIPHHVLNAKHHEKEAEIIADAGQQGAVTIATNMAGRGTDIVLGGNQEREIEMVRQDPKMTDEQKERRIAAIREDWQVRHDKVVALGGLHIIGTERHESRRIDNQLRGRAGRQGDPGSSRFYVSLEDDLMRLFGSDSARSIMERLGMDEDAPVEHPLISRAIENAQKKVEGRNFEIRKHVLQYDDVINKQREVIYRQRRQVLEGESLRPNIIAMITDLVDEAMELYIDPKLDEEDWDLDGLLNHLQNFLSPAGVLPGIELKDLDRDEIRETVLSHAEKRYAIRETEWGEERARELERVVLLRTVDEKWTTHIDEMHELRQGVGLRGYGQQDPLVEYRNESHNMFQEMIRTIKQEVVRLLFHLQVGEAPQRQQAAVPLHAIRPQVGAMGEPQGSEGPQKMPKGTPVTVNKIGRNEPCPCGSGKKHKKCCGKD